MALFLDLAHHFPMRWIPFFRRAQRLTEALLRSPIEVRLSRAVRRGDAQRLVALLDASNWPLDKPLSPLRQDSSLRRSHQGHTLLHLAVGGGYLACVKALVERGAAVDATTSWGFTPAMLAAVAADVAILHYLEMHGADLTRREPSLGTFVDDFGSEGATVPDLFESYAEESFESAKARHLEEEMDALLDAGATALPAPGRL